MPVKAERSAGVIVFRLRGRAKEAQFLLLDYGKYWEYPKGHVEKGEDELVRYDSSARAWRRFCRRCGSTLTFEGERWPGEVHVVVANLDGPLDRAPQAHSYFDCAVEWVRPADDLPRLGGETGNQPLAK